MRDKPLAHPRPFRRHRDTPGLLVQAPTPPLLPVEPKVAIYVLDEGTCGVHVA